MDVHTWIHMDVQCTLLTAKAHREKTGPCSCSLAQRRTTPSHRPHNAWLGTCDENHGNLGSQKYANALTNPTRTAAAPVALQASVDPHRDFFAVFSHGTVLLITTGNEDNLAPDTCFWTSGCQGAHHRPEQIFLADCNKLEVNRGPCSPTRRKSG